MENSFEALEEEFIVDNNFRERVAIIGKAQSIARAEIENEEENFFDRHLDNYAN